MQSLSAAPSAAPSSTAPSPSLPLHAPIGIRGSRSPPHGATMQRLPSQATIGHGGGGGGGGGGRRPSRMRRLSRRLRHAWRALSDYWAAHWDFHVIFIVYMFSTLFVGTVLLALLAPSYAVVDQLLLATSAFVNSSLIPMNLGALPAASNVVVCAISYLGSGVLGSLGPVLLRRWSLRAQLSSASRSRLLEYRALGKVEGIVLFFLTVVPFMVFASVVLWFAATPSAAAALNGSGNSALGFSAFLAISAVNNYGAATTPNNLIPFYPYFIPLMASAGGTLLGMTFYPVWAWCTVYILSKITDGTDRAIYQYLLQHPRRCYTLLFSRRQTLWLVLAGVGIPAVEFVFYAALDWNGPAFNFMTTSQKFWNMVFMATTTRTSGFNSIAPNLLSPAMQVVLIGFMYLSAVPIVVAIRSTDDTLKDQHRKHGYTLLRRNYDGTMAETPVSPEAEDDELVDRDIINSQVRNFLLQHSAWIFVVTVVVCAIESNQILTDPNFSVLAIVFEIVSGYGGVGISLGYPTVSSSFCTVWQPASKVLLVSVMLLGRLRGLPSAVDRAVAFKPTLSYARHRAMTLTTPASVGENHRYNVMTADDPEFLRDHGVLLSQLSAD